MANDICSAVSPFAMAVAISPIMSVARGHIICAPIMVLEYASNTSRINPCSYPVIMDFPLSRMEKCPQRTFSPLALAVSAVMPTVAISGLV